MISQPLWSHAAGTTKDISAESEDMRRQVQVIGEVRIPRSATSPISLVIWALEYCHKQYKKSVTTSITSFPGCFIVSYHSKKKRLRRTGNCGNRGSHPLRKLERSGSRYNLNRSQSIVSSGSGQFLAASPQAQTRLSRSYSKHVGICVSYGQMVSTI